MPKTTGYKIVLGLALPLVLFGLLKYFAPVQVDVGSYSQIEAGERRAVVGLAEALRLHPYNHKFVVRFHVQGNNYTLSYDRSTRTLKDDSVDFSAPHRMLCSPISEADIANGVKRNETAFDLALNARHTHFELP
ncbi:MAG: hypothetical protein JO316_09840 [Abitibacteriaceae bacterium]|nr:hypothetical protein [Abditibacteriaceae bacterium]